MRPGGSFRSPPRDCAGGMAPRRAPRQRLALSAGRHERHPLPTLGVKRAIFGAALPRRSPATDFRCIKCEKSLIVMLMKCSCLRQNCRSERRTNHDIYSCINIFSHLTNILTCDNAASHNAGEDFCGKACDAAASRSEARKRQVAQRAHIGPAPRKGVYRIGMLPRRAGGRHPRVRVGGRERRRNAARAPCFCHMLLLSEHSSSRSGVPPSS